MPRLVLALLLVVAVGCDSGGGDTALAGPYEGDVTAAFVGGVSIDFEVRLDLDEPDAEGEFDGDLRVVRGPVGFADEYIGLGEVSGVVTGSSVTLSGMTTRTEVARAHGTGIRLTGGGTIDGGTIRLSSATLLDFAYGESEPVSITFQ